MAFLEIHAGPAARARLLEHGFEPRLFDVLVGASGGPKWLVLGALDRLLFPWLLESRVTPLASVGSSIGAWRHLCLAQPDPGAAVTRLEQAYLAQRYSARPDAAEVSRVAAGILAELLGRDGAAAVADHPLVHTHIIAARGRGPWRSRHRAALLAATLLTVLGNAARRDNLGWLLERTCFHSASRDGALRFRRMPTRYARLDADTVARAALASASIPLLAEGVADLTPGELFWDGGMTDYHFEPEFGDRAGLVLYPHFYPFTVSGWFDKPLGWRRTPASAWANLVLLAPSRAFIARLPRGRIPDRRDFRALGQAEREQVWRSVAAEGERLAEEFATLAATRDPGPLLAG